MIRNRPLAADYVGRAATRLRAIDVRYKARSCSDIIRESQEVVELALKGLLRAAGVDPPRVPDVAIVLGADRSRPPPSLARDVDRLAVASRALRRDGELAFYGVEDLTPSDYYRKGDADEARDAARLVVELVRPHVLGKAFG